MKCIITTKGANDYITYVNEDKNEVQVYQNREKIAHLNMECSTAAYNGSKLLFTVKKKGSVFVADLDGSNAEEIPSPYDSIFIKQVLRGFDNLILVLVDGKYFVYDYISGREVFSCENLRLGTVYDLSINKYGTGQAAGFGKEYCDDEEWRFHAVTFRNNIAEYSLDMELAAKFSLYEDFYERTICYDTSTGKASFPIFYVYNDAYCAKAVSENYIVYVPSYEHHVVIIADIYGKIHRFLAYPKEISNNSYFAYNEETDIVTIATNDCKIYRWYVNTVDTDLFEKMLKIYDQRTYFTSGIESDIMKLLNKALEQANGVSETDEEFASKTAMYKAKEYCRRISKDDIEAGFNSVLGSLRIKNVTDDAVAVEADSEIVENAVRSIYLKVLKNAFKEILGRKVDVKIKLDK